MVVNSKIIRVNGHLWNKKIYRKFQLKYKKLQLCMKKGEQKNQIAFNTKEVALGTQLPGHSIAWHSVTPPFQNVLYECSNSSVCLAGNICYIRVRTFIMKLLLKLWTGITTFEIGLHPVNYCSRLVASPWKLQWLNQSKRLACAAQNKVSTINGVFFSSSPFLMLGLFSS